MAGCPEFREKHIPEDMDMDKSAGVGELRASDESLVGDVA